MRPLTTCLAKPGRAPAPASPLAGSPRHPRRSVSRHAVAPPQQAARTAGKSSRAAPSVEAQPELVGVDQGGAGTANGYSNNVVAVDTALMPSATHTLPVRALRLVTAASALDSLSSPIVQFSCQSELLGCVLRSVQNAALFNSLYARATQ